MSCAILAPCSWRKVAKMRVWRHSPQQMTKIDDINRRILRELSRNGRLTNLELADRIGLSPSACLRRVQELERAGVIAGYRAVIDPARIGIGFTAFVTVGLSLHTKAAQEAFEARHGPRAGSDRMPQRDWHHRVHPARRMRRPCGLQAFPHRRAGHGPRGRGDHPRTWSWARPRTRGPEAGGREQSGRPAPSAFTPEERFEAPERPYKALRGARDQRRPKASAR